MKNSSFINGFKNSTNYVSKDLTNVIKGVAICLMLFHHFFTFPSWYQNTITYSYENVLTFLSLPTKICVGIFCFLTGYFYFFNNNKNYKYAIKKITNLHVNYLCVFIPFLILSLILGCYGSNYVSIILEFLGKPEQIMSFCWYVWFYYFVMLTLPLFVKIENKHILLGLLVGIFLPILIYGIYFAFIRLDLPFLNELITNFTTFYGVVVVGYMFAKYNVFNNVFDRAFKNKIKSKILILLINLILIAVAFLGRQFLPNVQVYILILNLDVIYVPLFIYGIINVATLIKPQKILKPFGFLGKYSLSMWFIHSVFFNCFSVYTQQILYLPKNIFLVYIWGVLICLALAFLIDYPVKYFTKLINEKIFK